MLCCMASCACICAIWVPGAAGGGGGATLCEVGPSAVRWSWAASSGSSSSESGASSSSAMQTSVLAISAST
eukprot:4423609-Pyramimonas_sp.AAC.1